MIVTTKKRNTHIEVLVGTKEHDRSEVWIDSNARRKQMAIFSKSGVGKTTLMQVSHLRLLNRILLHLVCDELLFLRLRTITASQMVAAGAFVPAAAGSAIAYQRLHEFCRIAVTLKPSSDSDIKAEVWLAGDWNQKFQAVGNGCWPERSATGRWRTPSIDDATNFVCHAP